VLLREYGQTLATSYTDLDFEIVFDKPRVISMILIILFLLK